MNLVLDFVPETVYRVARHFNKAKTTIPIIYVKVGGHNTYTQLALALTPDCFYHATVAIKQVHLSHVSLHFYIHHEGKCRHNLRS